MLLRRLCDRLGRIHLGSGANGSPPHSATAPTAYGHRRESRMKADSWAASKCTWCSLLPMHQMVFRLQLDSTGEEVDGSRPLSV